jgi:hypothetical protein
MPGPAELKSLRQGSLKFPGNLPGSNPPR